MGLMMQQCGHCMTKERRSRPREFSSQVWSLLVAWEEVSEAVIDQPLCDVCYGDIREILIDRSVEMEEALRSGIIRRPAATVSDTRVRAKATKGLKAKTATVTAKAARGKKPQKVSRIAS